MKLDALAMERQFADHIAPVWIDLPESVRGTFRVEPRLLGHAKALGIEAEATPRPARIPAYPAPRFGGPPLLTASYGDVKVGRRLGYGPFAFIEHGAGQSYAGDPAWPNQLITGSYAGGPDREDTELFLVPNEHSARRWSEAYPASRVEVVGSPRLAALPAREPGAGPVVAISFHWQTPHSLGPEAQTALGDYQPVLGELADAFTVIGHAHPKGDWPVRMQRIYQRVGIPFVDDFTDVCRKADVYVCDNSSTLFEFAATGRPVVVLNSRWYRKHVNHGLRFWDAAAVGLQVDRPAQLVDTVRRALEDPPEQQTAREAALDVVYPVRNGAAERAAAALTHWIQHRAEQAA